jgi:ABC-type nitrate/sulfonate/bicarbonate transport system permease component
MKYETLPHARPGGIAGLLELLIDHKGRADIYRLADDLAFEIDDLFPIVEAAQLLDFLHVEEGDAAITPPAMNMPSRRFCGRKSSSARPPSTTCCCCARSPARSRTNPTTPCRKNSSWTCSTSSSAKKRPGVSWKPPSTGAAMPSSSTSTPPAALHSSRSRRDGRVYRGRAKRLAGMKIDNTFARSLVPERTWPVFLDLIVAAVCLAGFYAVIFVARYWFSYPVPEVVISRSPAALPLYAFYSTCASAAYLLSLLFAVTYGYIAAYNKRVEALMIAALDILQSIPVLSFLPGVMLAMIALIPGRQLGIELGAILLIFTGQVWNMAFSFYSSLKSIPRELREACAINRFSAWQRFWQLELPFSAIGLIWNSMVSVAGGWFTSWSARCFPSAPPLPPAGPRLVPADRRQQRRHRRNGLRHHHHDGDHRADRSARLAPADRLVRQVQV